MTYDLVFGIITVFALLGIITLIALNDIHSKLNLSFIAFAFSVMLCITFLTIAGTQQTNELVVAYTRESIVFANFMPSTFLIFTMAFMGRAKLFTKAVIGALIGSLIIIPLAYLPNTIHPNISSHHNQPTVLGPFSWLTFLNFILVFGYSSYILFKYKKTADKVKKSQINFIVYTAGIAILANMILQIALPLLKVTTHQNTLTDPTVLVFIGVIAYSIAKHKLFDIKTIVLRTLGFAFIFGIVLIIFSVSISVPSRLVFSDLKLTNLQEFYFICASLLLALLFNPLRKWLEKITGKYFFQDRYNSDELVNSISKALASEVRLQNITKIVVAILKLHMHLKGVDIIVLDKDKIYFESGNYYQGMYDQLSKDLSTFNRDLTNIADVSPGPEMDILNGYGLSVVVKMYVQNEKVGYMLFSEKLSGAFYSKKDALVIDIVADELAIAIQNSRSYDQIRQFNASLQKKVEESTTQLLITNQELKEANSTKDDFISMVSHQLGTPLTVMEGFLSLVLQGFYGKDEHKKDDAIKKALSRTRIMKNLVFDLLNISRMSAGKFFLELSTINLDDVVSDEVNQLEEEAKDKNVKLTYHPPKDRMPDMQIDEPKTRQAIMNLINNAIFYSRNGNVDVYLDFDQKVATFKVVDNGIGVPEEQKPMLFTKFFRADNAVRESPNGTGIGLYLVKRVIEDQHGKIIFNSKLKEGSTFGFTLPISSFDENSAELITEAVEV